MQQQLDQRTDYCALMQTTDMIGMVLLPLLRLNNTLALLLKLKISLEQVFLSLSKTAESELRKLKKTGGRTISFDKYSRLMEFDTTHLDRK